MREARTRKENGRKAGSSGRREDWEKEEEVSRSMVYSGCPRSEWAPTEEQKEEPEVAAPLSSPPRSRCPSFQPIMSRCSRKEAWLHLAWFTWETPSRLWEIPSHFWETPSCMEEGGQEAPPRGEVEARNKSKWPLSNTQEEAEEEEAAEHRRRKEEPLRRSPSPSYG